MHYHRPTRKPTKMYVIVESQSQAAESQSQKERQVGKQAIGILMIYHRPTRKPTKIYVCSRVTVASSRVASKQSPKQ